MINYYLVSLILLLSFTQAIQETFGVSISISNFCIEILIILAFLVNIIKSKKHKFYFYFIILLFLFHSLISGLYNETPELNMLLFLRRMILPFLLFWSISQDTFDQHHKNNIYKLIIFLFLIQLPVVIVKYFIYGQLEKELIGSISNTAGSLSTILPLYASSFLFAKYLFHKKLKYLLLVIAYLLFGIIGAKRAIIFYLLFSMTFISVLFFWFKEYLGYTKKPIFKRVVVFGALAIPLLYIAIRLSPTLNPDNVLWGRFDLNFTIDYLIQYEERDNVSDIGNLGRIPAIGVSYKLLSKEESNLLLGLGPGKLINSVLLEESNILYRAYGIGYGARTGILFLFLQVGLIGVILYIFINISIIRKVFWKIKKGNKFAFIFLCCHIVFLIDIVTYSDVFLTIWALMSVHFIFMGLLFNESTPQV